MVFFTCNHCGASLKKNKVEKHRWMECRRPISVSCHDCLKDFMGQEYEKHVKCITEDEKYSAKDFVPKTTSNKGTVKQQAWVELVRGIQQTCKDLSKNEAELLDQISKYDNVPRKKPQFQNFVRNVFHQKMSIQTVERVWNLLAEAKSKTDQQVGNAKVPAGKSVEKAGNHNGNSTDNVGGDLKDNTSSVEQEVARKKKRKKKEKMGEVDALDSCEMKTVNETDLAVGSSTQEDDDWIVCIKCGAKEKIKHAKKRRLADDQVRSH